MPKPETAASFDFDSPYESYVDLSPAGSRSASATFRVTMDEAGRAYYERLFMNRLEEAFAAVERVHNVIYEYGSKPPVSSPVSDMNYLTLECLGLYNHQPDGALWAASFDAALPEEWYEHPEQQLTSARSRSPEEAILAAAQRFQKHTGVRIFQETEKSEVFERFHDDSINTDIEP